MTTDPGDLVARSHLRLRHNRLRRRTMGASLDHYRHLRVALALARARIMGARYPYYERVRHITLKSIANNAEIDVIREKSQQVLEPLREGLNRAMGKSWEEWQVPRKAEDPWDADTQELFHALRAEQARREQGSQKKIGDALAAINHNLKRKYTLDALPGRPPIHGPSPRAETSRRMVETTHHPPNSASNAPRPT